MVICPKCNAENRPEAAFCANCGTILLAQPVVIKPIPTEPVPPKPTPPESVTPEPVLSEPIPSEPISSTPAEIQPALESVFVSGFPSRPEGSIFGERFRYTALVSQDEHDIRYTLTEICQPPAPCVQICSNPFCCTVHAPTGVIQEKFCSHCGHLLDQQLPVLSLEEADYDRFDDQQQVIDLLLAHPNIHPPITLFQQDLPGGLRYCLVTPYSQELPANPEVSQVLDWGLQLADSLDYLHNHGVAFGEELSSASFGLAEGKIVWRNFNNVRVLPILADREKINNVRLPALSLYWWLTGKTTYAVDTSLTPSLNRLFHQALVGEGFNSGAKFADQISLAIKAGLTPLNLDYYVGRRTHPGKTREENEDSLLCLTLSRIEQGVSQPAGLFAIADGMGGHAMGDLASSLAIQTIVQKASSELASLQNLTPEEYISWLKDAVQAANLTLFESRQKADNDMGSTLVCALLLGNQAYLAHLGDSRIYLLRDKSIQQLTSDHSLVQQLVTNGQISRDEARFHPQRNVILQSLGEKAQAEADIYTQELLPGDRLLLCSDGLSGMLDDQKIRIIIHESQSPQVACDYLIDAANLAGGEDNISIILVEVILA